MPSPTKEKTNSLAKHQFIQHLLSLSYEKEQTGALKEWKLLNKKRKSYEKKEALCICQHRIKHAYFVYNKKTGKTITVGSTCCKNFDISFQSETKPNLFFKHVDKWIKENGYEVIDDIETYAERIKNILRKDCHDKYLDCKKSIPQLKKLKEELEELTLIKGVYYLTDILELVVTEIASLIKADAAQKKEEELKRQEWERGREAREAKQKDEEREEKEREYQKEREKKERKEQKEREEIRLEIEEGKKRKKEMDAKNELENKARKLKYLELEKKQELEDAPLLAAFTASLSPKDRIIHDLAAKMLNTRYDPKRTNAYLKWIAMCR